MSQTQPNILEDYGLISMKVNLLNEELSKMNKQKTIEMAELAQISINKDRLLEEEKKAREAYKTEETKITKAQEYLENIILEQNTIIEKNRALKNELADFEKEKKQILSELEALNKSKINIEESNKIEREKIEQERLYIEKRKEALIQVIQNV